MSSDITDAIRRQVLAEEGARTGRVGGKIAAANMTVEARRARARKAAKARWANKGAPVVAKSSTPVKPVIEPCPNCGRLLRVIGDIYACDSLGGCGKQYRMAG